MTDPSAKIGDGAVIGPNVTIGPNCEIGDGARVTKYNKAYCVLIVSDLYFLLDPKWELIVL